MVSTRSTRRRSHSPPAPNPRPTKSPRVAKLPKSPPKQNLTDIQLVLLDIEGTICPITFVKDTLFPYALNALPTVLATQWDSPTFAPYRDSFPEEHRSSPQSLEAHVKDLTERDVKVAYLKNLQGHLWEDGYKSGAYSTPVYPDVLEFFEKWPSKRDQSQLMEEIDVNRTTEPVDDGKQNGTETVANDHTDATNINTTTTGPTLDTSNGNGNDNSKGNKPEQSLPSKREIAIYSSGSIFAQELLFQHIRNPSFHADLDTTTATTADEKSPASASLPILNLHHLPVAYFDTTTAGPKTSPESYTTIARHLFKSISAISSSNNISNNEDHNNNNQASKILFLSDNTAEIRAALEAGMKAVVVDRPGNKALTEQERQELDVVQEFGELGIY